MPCSRVAQFVLLLAFSSFSVAPAQQTRASLRRLDGSSISAGKATELADAELKADGVTGAQLLILNGGKVVWTHAYGLRDVAQSLPMTSTTNIWAGSFTKSVFATWVMRQVQQGTVNLDEPVVHMLAKPLNEYEPYKDLAGDMVRDPRWPLITPRMLLAHTSGLANFAWLEPDKKMHLHFQPGARYAYSGEGINLLQFAVEQNLGIGLEAALQKDIFVPLGMARTGLMWHDNFGEELALRYGVKGNYLATTHRPRAVAAGSMATTARDFGVFLEALLAHRLLEPGTQTTMFSPQVFIRSTHEFPTLEEATGTEGPAVGLAYGLGWGLLTKTRFGTAFFKEGHGDGAENFLTCFERNGTCMVLMTNSDNGELAFRPLLEKLLGDTVTPWAWEGFTREQVLANEEHSGK